MHSTKHYDTRIYLQQHHGYSAHVSRSMHLALSIAVCLVMLMTGQPELLFVPVVCSIGIAQELYTCDCSMNTVWTHPVVHTMSL